MTRKWYSPIGMMISQTIGQTVLVGDARAARERMLTGTCLKTGSGKKFRIPIQTPQKVIARAVREVDVIVRDGRNEGVAVVARIKMLDPTTA